jgi:hypothetical protein
VTDLPEIPEAAVQAAAEVLFRDYESQYAADRLTWRDFAALARQSLEAALPHLRPGMATEWGVHCTNLSGQGQFVAIYGTSEGNARGVLASYRHGYPDAVLVRREVGPWTPAPEEEKGNG